MQPSYPADSHSAPARYAPSVPMSVYRELASELRANKSAIDSLNSRNQQLLQQNKFLKQEIHNMVQSALSLGQAAGVARPAPQAMGQVGGMPNSAQHMGQGGFPNSIAPDTLARLAQAEANATPAERAYERYMESLPEQLTSPPAELQRPELQRPEPQRSELQRPELQRPESPRPETQRQPNPAFAPTQSRMPQPITPATQKSAPKASAKASNPKNTRQRAANPKASKAKSDNAATHQPKPIAARQQSAQTVGRRTESVAAKKTSSQTNPKLFTEQSGTFRSSALDAQENKEISGIWLVLSIILIVVTAFGAGFLIMKPLLNDR